jgi:hypothetical protein
MLSIEGGELPVRVAGEEGRPLKIPKKVRDCNDEVRLWTSKHLLRGLLCLGTRQTKWAGLCVNGRHGKIPDDHQYLPLDLLQSNWLESLCGPKFPRTRLLVADEGGLGKTYSVSLAIANHFLEKKGVIIVLCPPMLKEHWKKEIQVCMHDHSAKVKIIRAKSLEKEMTRGIYIVSKYSVMDRYYEDGIEWIPKSSLAVIDEIHQGSQGKPEIDEAGNLDADGPLWKCQNELCKSAEKVIGLTASPFQTEIENLLLVLQMMGGEAAESVKDLREKIFSTKSWKEMFVEWNELLVEGLDLVEGSKEEVESWVKKIIATNFPVFSWMCEEDIQEIISSFGKNGSNIMLDKNQGHRLLRDFHPLGRFFSITRRDDLGTIAASKFRQRKDITHWVDLDPMHIELSKNSKSSIITGSWIENLTSGRYEGIAEDLELPSEFPPDGRWPIINRYIDEEKAINDNQIRRGIVIFVNYLGTLEGIFNKIKAQYADDVVRPLMLHGSMDETEKKSQLQTAADIARSDLLPVLICTSAAEVGIDMEWASVGIMWETNSNPESLLQRSWRLDRRKKDTDCPEFRIIHFRHELNQHLIDKLNNSYAKSSSILGRKIEDLIPKVTKEEPEKIIERIWPEKGGVFALVDGEIEALKERIGGSAEVSIEELWFQKMEKLFWRWVCDITGLSIDLEYFEEAAEAGNDNFLKFMNESYDDGPLGKHLDEKTLNTIWSLSNICSISEMQSLWLLADTSISVEKYVQNQQPKLGLIFNPAKSPHRFGTVTIHRHGELSNNLLDMLLNIVKQNEMLNHGSGSSYIGWIFEDENYDGTKLLIDIKWLEINLKFGHILYYFEEIYSSISCMDEHSEGYLEESDGWENLLIESINYARGENLGSLHGEMYDGSEKRPILSEEDEQKIIFQTEKSIIGLSEQIVRLYSEIPSHEQGELAKLFAHLDDVKSKPSKVIPLLWIGGAE